MRFLLVLLNLGRALLAFLAFAREFSFFTFTALFALVGHVLLLYLLSAVDAAGVDFATLDKGRIAAPVLQIGLFILQIGLILYAIAKSGIDKIKTYLGVASLLAATGFLMLTFVAGQCWLYGYCL